MPRQRDGKCCSLAYLTFDSNLTILLLQKCLHPPQTKAKPVGAGGVEHLKYSSEVLRGLTTNAGGGFSRAP